MKALDLTTFDECPRKYALSRDYEPYSISPMGLLYAGVEGGLTGDAIDAIREITSRKDLDPGPLAPLSQIRHIGFLAEIIALALKRRFGTFRRVADREGWQSALFETKAGLQRIILLSYLDDDSLRSYAHSWGTLGELVSLQRDITLTAVVVGAQRGGRRHSHWAKAYRHPVQRSALRFARRKGGKQSGFTDGWRECWREATDISAEVWLNQMDADGVLEELIATHRVSFNARDQRIQQAHADMVQILPQMAEATIESLMRRGSCDSPFGACPFSPLCWSPSAVEMTDLAHLYRPRSAPQLA